MRASWPRGIHVSPIKKHGVVTGFGRSATSYINNEDPNASGEGVFQGSSSAAPLYTLNADISLSAYDHMGTGATFIHPISKVAFSGKASQFVDDKTQFLNLLSLTTDHDMMRIPRHEQSTLLQQAGTRNSQAWADLLWVSGGNLNLDKCFTDSMLPTYSFTTASTKVEKLPQPHPLTISNPSNHQSHTIAQIAPTFAKRTLGVIMAPDGSNRLQLKHTLLKAKTFLGQIRHATLSGKARWLATQMVLEPGVIYPLMASFFTQKELFSIQSIMSQFQCSALGLNRNFP